MHNHGKYYYIHGNSLLKIIITQPKRLIDVQDLQSV